MLLENSCINSVSLTIKREQIRAGKPNYEYINRVEHPESACRTNSVQVEQQKPKQSVQRVFTSGDW